MKCMRKFCLPKGMSDRVSSSAPSRCMVTSFISIHFTGSVPTHVTANAITKISCQPSSKHSIVTNLAYEVDGLGTIFKFVLSSIQLKFIHHFKKNRLLDPRYRDLQTRPARQAREVLARQLYRLTKRPPWQHMRPLRNAQEFVQNFSSENVFPIRVPSF